MAFAIVWDERKRQSNIRRHGVDFADVGASFFEVALVLPAHSGRSRAVAPNGGRLIAVVFKRLGSEGVSIVSARPASDRERRLYAP